jgi:hypothetical protein
MRRTPSSSGFRNSPTQPGFARPLRPPDESGAEGDAPDSAIVPVATASKMPHASPVSSAPAPVAIQVAMQVFNVARVSRGTYEVRDTEGSLIGTITLSHGFLQLTAERAPLATMMDVAKIAMGLGVLQLPPPRPVDAPR